jgi:hypothetical protein
MMRRFFATVLAIVALICASLAWLGWLFQHTAGDPGRSQQLAAAVLADPTARHELAGDLAVSVAGAANTALVDTFGPQVPVKIDGHDPKVRQVAESVLADPQFTASITKVVAAAHTNALGIGPEQPVVLDTAMVTSVARQYLTTIDPTLAAEIPTLPSIPVRLPTAEVPVASHVRATTDSWVPRLELIAVVCLLGALVFGERARVLRWAGIWAICAGLFWMAAPTLVSWMTDAWVPGHRAIVHALFRGVSGSVQAVAVNLIVLGVLATAASIVLSILNSPKHRGKGGTPSAGDDHQHPDGARRFGYKGRSQSEAPAKAPARLV